nr:hypothetical protein [uncultured Dyadobacter sp.]
MDTETRLAELNAKPQLTDDEMKEVIRLSPPNTIKSLPNLLTLGVKDVNAFGDNTAEAKKIAKDAFEKGFYIETISLRLQSIEICLRMYVVGKSKKGKIIDSDSDKRTFGNYVNDCEQMGFDKSLVQELKDFNKNRVNAIHKFLLGEIKYADLKDVCIATDGLGNRVLTYVAQEIGTPVV